MPLVIKFFESTNRNSDGNLINSLPLLFGPKSEVPFKHLRTSPANEIIIEQGGILKGEPYHPTTAVQ